MIYLPLFPSNQSDNFILGYVLFHYFYYYFYFYFQIPILPSIVIYSWLLAQWNVTFCSSRCCLARTILILLQQHLNGCAPSIRMNVYCWLLCSPGKLLVWLIFNYFQFSIYLCGHACFHHLLLFSLRKRMSAKDDHFWFIQCWN